MEKQTALVIMAAGIGSRFGKGVKQLTPVGPNGELIIDYSIRDAAAAGFNKVVFIIRKEILSEFQERIGDRVSKEMEVSYVFQELSDIPQGFEEKLAGRTKPWGTGQAILCCKGAVTGPFIVINADDYYGQEAFRKVHDYLIQEHDQKEVLNFCMAGYRLKNTLSDFGTVTRGIVQADADGYLTDVVETYNLLRTPDGAGVKNEDGSITPVPIESLVSMNMWGFYPEFIEVLEKEFVTFLSDLSVDDKKKEYLLPILIGELVRNGRAKVLVLQTDDQWFGVTYQEDKELVEKRIQKLIEEGVYD